MNSKMNIADKLLNYGILINNAITDTDISDALIVYGVTIEKLKKGKTLLEDLDDLVIAQKMEYGEQLGATDKVKSLWKEANHSYIISLKIARILFKENQLAQTALQLHGLRKISFSGWMHQAQSFYSNLNENAEFLAAFAEYAYTPEKLAKEQKLIDDLEEAKHIQSKEKGEAQQATIDRDKKLDTLDEWISDFKIIVRIALEDNPQRLEKLGILARS